MELNTNSIAFIGLCNEYCLAVENARETQLRDFVASMLRLLPRIYIAATDLTVTRPIEEDDEPYLDSYLDEDYYESVRREIESLLGADDVYLEVFEEDMRYEVSRYPYRSEHCGRYFGYIPSAIQFHHYGA